MTPWPLGTIRADTERFAVAKGKLISSDINRMSRRQHKTPCSDCPMTRQALPGWLGDYKPGEYVRLAHSDHMVNCHVIVNQQCAGMAIYRANVVKRCDPPNLRLPKNTDKVFATPMEFLAHHERKPNGR